MLMIAVMIPGTVEVPFVNAGTAVIIGIAIVPELVNHRLPVFLCNDHIGQIAD